MAGTCYFFNPANVAISVMLNGLYLGEIPPTSTPGYTPWSIATNVSRHDDDGSFSVNDPNTIILSYTDYRNVPRTLSVTICTSGLSVDDDVVVFAGLIDPYLGAGTWPSPCPVVVMNARGFVIGTPCSQSPRHQKAHSQAPKRPHHRRKTHAG